MKYNWKSVGGIIKSIESVKKYYVKTNNKKIKFILINNYIKPNRADLEHIEENLEKLVLKENSEYYELDRNRRYREDYEKYNNLSENDKNGVLFWNDSIRSKFGFDFDKEIYNDLILLENVIADVIELKNKNKRYINELNSYMDKSNKLLNEKSIIYIKIIIDLNNKLIKIMDYIIDFYNLQKIMDVDSGENCFYELQIDEEGIRSVGELEAREEYKNEEFYENFNYVYDDLEAQQEFILGKLMQERFDEEFPENNHDNKIKILKPIDRCYSVFSEKIKQCLKQYSKKNINSYLKNYKYYFIKYK